MRVIDQEGERKSAREKCTEPRDEDLARRKSSAVLKVLLRWRSPWKFPRQQPRDKYVRVSKVRKEAVADIRIFRFILYTSFFQQ